MRRTLLISLMICTFITFAQKKTNGTIFIDHPAIAVVEGMTQAFVNGDTDKVASYLTDDFKFFNGVNTNKSYKGQDKASYLKNVKGWKDGLDYYSIKRAPGAYPDALEYKYDTQKDVVWVQTWETLKGVHKKTGVKVDMPIHRLFVVTKDGKIKSITDYSNSSIGDEINQSYDVRENGTIYNHHENINTVRKMVYAFENKDFEKAYAPYDEKAQFRDINLPGNKTFTLEEQKANDKKLLAAYDLESVDMVGYPDYLHYNLEDAKVVLSWWNFNFVRKSDKKQIQVPILLMDNFNDAGKIIEETAYYSAKAMD